MALHGFPKGPWLLWLSVISLGCGDAKDIGVIYNPTNPGGNTGGQTTVILPMGGIVAPGIGGGSPVGNGKPEVCNGLDDDENGIEDDLDTNNDGVCDCIRIATLGNPGIWGQGDVFGAWLSARASDGAQNLGDQVITPELIKNFQVIVVQNVREGELGRTYSTAEVAALENWVRAGGGLMTLIGYEQPTEIRNVNRLLAPFGMSYVPLPILQQSGGITVSITDFSSHPLTTSLSAVGIDNGYPVHGSGEVYARGRQYPVGLAQVVDKGHVNLWGDEWITYNSEWVGRLDYQIELFWVNTIKWMTPAHVCQVKIPPILIP